MGGRTRGTQIKLLGGFFVGFWVIDNNVTTLSKAQFLELSKYFKTCKSFDENKYMLLQTLEDRYIKASNSRMNKKKDNFAALCLEKYKFQRHIVLIESK